MIKSVRLKLTVGYVGTIALLLTVFSVFTYVGMRTILTENLDDRLYSGGKSLEISLSEYSPKHPNEPKSLFERDDDGDKFFIDDINEETEEIFFSSTVYIQLQVLAEPSPSPPQIIARTATLRKVSLPFRQDTYLKILKDPYVSETVTGIFSFPLRVVSLIVRDREKNPYVLKVAMSFEEVKTTLSNLVYTFAVLLPILLVVFTAVGFMFMKKAFAPVKKMVSATRNITAEDLALRLDPLESRDEIGELADTLNDMIARLDHSFKRISQFSGDVAHELKTPLAEIKCNAEVTLNRERPAAEYRQALQNVIEDTARLQSTVENLLLLARMDAGRAAGSFAPIDLSRVFFEVFEENQPLAEKKGIILKFDKIDAVRVRGDIHLLRLAFTNLTLNAIRYTPVKGSVTFRLGSEADRAAFTVSDTGIGIPQKHIPHLFDRFYRVEQSRSQDTGGSGLGLAIAKKAIDLHHGTIQVQSAPGRGTTFVVSLPCLA